MPLTKTTTLYRRPYKRYYKRRPYGKPSKNFSKKVNKVVMKQSEKKYWDVATTAVSVDITGSITDLTSIAQGDTDQTRDGDQLYLRSIKGKAQIQVADTTNIVRFIIFQWYMDTNVVGSAPTVSQILQSVGTAIGPMSGYNHDGRYNFRILYDRTCFLDTTDKVQCGLQWYINKGLRRKMQFHGGATGGKNKIYLLLLSDSGAATHPSVAYYNRTAYSDF